MIPYYIYMIELKLEKNLTSEETYYYIGKTDNIADRLITHISRNRKSTQLIRPNKARVVAICEIHEIIFDSDKIDRITSRAENDFVYDKIVNGDGGEEKNKARYRGGYYTPQWECSSKFFKAKNINKESELYKKNLVFKGRYEIDDYLYEESNKPKKEYEKQKIKRDIEEIVREYCDKNKER